MEEKFKYGLGCKNKPSNILNYTTKPPMVGHYDKIIDWKKDNENLPKKFLISEDRIPTVRNQYQYNACVGFGIAEILGIFCQMEFGKERIMSPWFIYSNPECRDAYEGEGMYPEDALSGTKKSGTVPIEDFNVEMEVPDILKAFLDRKDELSDEAKKYKIKGYAEIPSYAIKEKKAYEIKKALVKYNMPLLMISDTFFKGGSHCTILIGYNEDGTFIFQNSWGLDYKNNGRYNIPVEKISNTYVLFDEEISLPFKDVQETDWFYKDVKNSFFAGLVNGITEDSFEPNNNLTRAEAATIACRVLEKTQSSIDAYNESMKQSGNQYKDISVFRRPKKIIAVKDVPSHEWYTDYISTIIFNDIMKGEKDSNNETIFRPEDNITRAEAIAIINRLYIKCRDAILPNYDNYLANVIITDFKDIKKSDWFYKDVENGVLFNFVNGNEDGNFYPNNNITRAEFTAIVVRFTKRLNDIFKNKCIG